MITTARKSKKVSPAAAARVVQLPLSASWGCAEITHGGRCGNSAPEFYLMITLNPFKTIKRAMEEVERMSDEELRKMIICQPCRTQQLRQGHKGDITDLETFLQARARKEEQQQAVTATDAKEKTQRESARVFILDISRRPHTLAPNELRNHQMGCGMHASSLCCNKKEPATAYVATRDGPRGICEVTVAEFKAAGIKYCRELTMAQKISKSIKDKIDRDADTAQKNAVATNRNQSIAECARKVGEGEIRLVRRVDQGIIMCGAPEGLGCCQPGTKASAYMAVAGVVSGMCSDLRDAIRPGILYYNNEADAKMCAEAWYRPGGVPYHQQHHRR